MKTVLTANVGVKSAVDQHSNVVGVAPSVSQNRGIINRFQVNIIENVEIVGAIAY